MLGFALDMVDVWSQEQLDQLRSLPKMDPFRKYSRAVRGLHKQFFCNSTTHSTP